MLDMGGEHIIHAKIRTDFLAIRSRTDYQKQEQGKKKVTRSTICVAAF